jgi:hypothetical protein
MSFSCPHLRPGDEHCHRLNIDCVPGRRGCVLERGAESTAPADPREPGRDEEKDRPEKLPWWMRPES